MITPENETERRIVNSLIFTEALQHQSRGAGHPERDLQEHISQILTYIDGQPWQTYRTDLRFLGLTHDLGKYRVQRDALGNIIGKPHAQISEEIAREHQFTTDERLLTLIRLHDKYFGFFRNTQQGKPFKEDKFRSLYEGVDLDTLIRFNYADSNAREKTSVRWFEDRCVALGMCVHIIYGAEPGVLR